MKTNAQDDTDSVEKTICEPDGKPFKLMESDSDSDVRVSKTLLMKYRDIKWRKKMLNQLIHYNGGNLTNIDIRNWHFSPRLLCMPATTVPCERLLSSASCNVNKTRSSLEPNTCLCVCVVGYPTIFRRENAYSISCLYLHFDRNIINLSINVNGKREFYLKT